MAFYLFRDGLKGGLIDAVFLILAIKLCVTFLYFIDTLTIQKLCLPAGRRSKCFFLIICIYLYLKKLKVQLLVNFFLLGTEILCLVCVLYEYIFNLTMTNIMHW